MGPLARIVARARSSCVFAGRSISISWDLLSLAGLDDSIPRGAEQASRASQDATPLGRSRTCGGGLAFRMSLRNKHKTPCRLIATGRIDRRSPSATDRRFRRWRPPSPIYRTGSVTPWPHCHVARRSSGPHDDVAIIVSRRSGLCDTLRDLGSGHTSMWPAQAGRRCRPSMTRCEVWQRPHVDVARSS